MQSDVEGEIESLHRFFKDWFNGEVPNDPTTFQRVEQILSDEFCLITPDGTAMDRNQLVEYLHDAWGSYRERERAFRIWCENISVKAIAPGFWIATYEEWQERLEGTTARISTAILEQRTGAPHGVAWRHVHETWMKLKTPPADS